MKNGMKQIRKTLKLSKNFVAKQLGITTSAMTAIENGTRHMTPNEMKKLSELYGVSIKELLNHVYGYKKDDIERNNFSGLSDLDKKEVMTLINFKRRYQKNREGQ